MFYDLLHTCVKWLDASVVCRPISAVAERRYIPRIEAEMGAAPVHYIVVN